MAVLGLALVVGCGGGGGGGGGNAGGSGGSGGSGGAGGSGGSGGGPVADESAPTIDNVEISDSNTTRSGPVTVQGGQAATLYIWFDWADPDADYATAHVSYITQQRDLSATIAPSDVGQKSGTEIMSIAVPSTDGGGESALDFWIEDDAGHASDKVQLHYTTTQPPPPPVPGADANVAGKYTINFTSVFGDSISDTYKISQIAGTNGIGWTASCNDLSNTINCFFMSNLSGSIDDSTDQGHTFGFAMGDGFCVGISGTFTIDGDNVAISGTETTCNNSPAFPAGNFTGKRK